MLLGNPDYILDGDTVPGGAFDGLYLIGLADAGWVDGPGSGPA